MQKLQNLYSVIFYFFIIVITSAMLSSCYREPEFPDAVLNSQKMTDILSDIHLAEAKVAGMSAYAQYQRDSLMEVYYRTIFKLHAVEADDFDKSMDAYMKNPEAMADIYEKVLEQLQKEQTGNTVITVDSIK
jgi:hypothetical protein